MLSVTIILSFSILLGYLSFVDSGLFNQYKRVFAAPREVVTVYQYGEPFAKMRALTEMVQTASPETQFYHYTGETTTLTQYGNVKADLTFLPSGKQPVFEMIASIETGVGSTAEEIRPLFGRDAFDLRGNEAIINECFYRALGGTGEFPLQLFVPFSWADGSNTVFSLSVVGVCSDEVENGDSTDFYLDESGQMAGFVQIYMSQEVLGARGAQDMVNPRHMIAFLSQTPEVVASYADQLDIIKHAACIAQDEAMEHIRIQKATKAVIALILLLLLGTNLYSSFSNALNGRKFEIGVKRAIGASSFAIVKQFLLEGMAVMLVNILFSVLIVTDILAVYKIYQTVALGNEWVISVSPHSIAMFAACSVSLTLVFSLLFAYQSTRVEIVQYLKAE